MTTSKIAAATLCLFALAVTIAVCGASEPPGVSGMSSLSSKQSRNLRIPSRDLPQAGWVTKSSVESGQRHSQALMVTAAKRSSNTREKRNSGSAKVWRSEELSLLGIGLGVGDVDGDGNNDIVIIAPSTVYLYRVAGGDLSLVTEYSAGTLELKSVDVARLRKQGPPRIYISAQNRGSVSSFVLEYRNGKLVPVIDEVPYFLRVIIYPTRGPFLLGQKKGTRKMYDGPIVRLEDKGDALQPMGRFGVPLKIPVFGFAIGDFDGDRKPLIAVYDKSDHLRVYQPDGKRLYVSQDYYGSSDVRLRWGGVDRQLTGRGVTDLEETVFFRPRIMSLDLRGGGKYEILAITHVSKTRRLLSRTRMLEEGRVVGLEWNGDALEERWTTPKIAGMLTDFAVDSLPGIAGLRLITLERKKTDWLSLISSRSQIRAYDMKALLNDEIRGRHRDED